jgi:hypothetical protein
MNPLHEAWRLKINRNADRILDVVVRVAAAASRPDDGEAARRLEALDTARDMLAAECGISLHEARNAIRAAMDRRAAKKSTAASVDL